MWWVYFDDPKQCAEPGACGLSADFGGENPVAVFGRMDSTIASENEGTYFIGRIGGFTPSEGSQIWMWIFGHGEANFDDGRRLARQLLTPELPGAGAPHLGNTIDGRQGFSAAIIKFDIPGDDELDDE
ncbi:MAG: hypothetical protein QNJ46_14350 [Leptolyngbyaceae cyanobacterium MO_188.B28]|nr:hypothetical protein [Leptolyngbyaceae cyanobacterium MO_188.B28]